MFASKLSFDLKKGFQWIISESVMEADYVANIQDAIANLMAVTSLPVIFMTPWNTRFMYPK